MHIAIDTSEPLSPLDYRILTVLGDTATAPASEAEEATAPAKPAAKKAPAKKAAAPKAKPAPVEEEAADEDNPYTAEEAVRIASELLADGETAKVKSALKEVGVARVGEVAEEDLERFIDLLNAESLV